MFQALAGAVVHAVWQRMFAIPVPTSENPPPSPAGVFDVQTQSLRVLACNHFTYRKAKVGDTVPCSYCGEEVRVVRIKG